MVNNLLRRVAVGSRVLGLPARVCLVIDARSTAGRLTTPLFRPRPVELRHPALAPDLARVRGRPANNAGRGNLSRRHRELPHVRVQQGQHAFILQHIATSAYYARGSYLKDLPMAVHAISEPRWSPPQARPLHVNGNACSGGLEPDVTHLSPPSASTGPAISVRARRNRARWRSLRVCGGRPFVSSTRSRQHQVPGLRHRRRTASTACTHNPTQTSPHHGSGGYGPAHGNELFNKNMVFQRQVAHSRWATGTVRRTRTAKEPALDPTPTTPLHRELATTACPKTSWPTPSTCLLELDCSIAVHISARTARLVLRGTYGGDPQPGTPAWKPTQRGRPVKRTGPRRGGIPSRSRPPTTTATAPRST